MSNKQKKSIITDYIGAIFDVDGTLLDSMAVWENVAEDYLRTRGVTPHPAVNDELNALAWHEIPTYFQIEYGLHETVQEIQRGIYELLEKYYFYEASLKKGVAEVLNAMRENRLKMTVATATDRWLVEPALKRCGIFEYFERIFTCGEEETHKSSPDIYIRAAASMQTDIARTLVVEDALYAIRSAKRAGFPVVGVHDPSARGKQEEIKELCDYYFISMDEMLD